MYMYPQFKLLFAIILLFSVTAVSQTTFTPDLDDTADFVAAVYADKVTALGYDTPEGLQQFKSRLSRVEIVLTQEVFPGKINSLSEVPLITTYNPELTYDLGENFNPETFNPFKYKLDFFRTDAVVRDKVDETDYIINILPQ